MGFLRRSSGEPRIVSRKQAMAAAKMAIGRRFRRPVELVLDDFAFPSPGVYVIADSQKDLHSRSTVWVDAVTGAVLKVSHAISPEEAVAIAEEAIHRSFSAPVRIDFYDIGFPPPGAYVVADSRENPNYRNTVVVDSVTGEVLKVSQAESVMPKDEALGIVAKALGRPLREPVSATLRGDWASVDPRYLIIEDRNCRGVGAEFEIDACTGGIRFFKAPAGFEVPEAVALAVAEESLGRRLRRPLVERKWYRRPAYTVVADYGVLSLWTVIDAVDGRTIIGFGWSVEEYRREHGSGGNK